MWATEVATDEPEELQRRLFDEHAIEVVVREWEGRSLLRVSIAPYNDEARHRAARRSARDAHSGLSAATASSRSAQTAAATNRVQGCAGVPPV